MSAYSIQTDPAWMASEHAVSNASSDSDLPDLPRPLQIRKTPRGAPSATAFESPAGARAGLSDRQSRMPGFKHMQKMLNSRRAPPPNSKVRWDPYSGELSDTGNPGQVTPSTYKPPAPAYHFEVRRRSVDRSRRPVQARSVRQSRSVSPVSMLRPDEFEFDYRPSLDMPQNDPRPVSPISIVQSQQQDDPKPSRMSLEQQPTTIDPQHLPETPVSLVKVPKRKPVSSFIGPSPNHPSHLRNASQATSIGPEANDDGGDHEDLPVDEPNSHFSWTTGVPSVPPSNRQTMESPSMGRHNKLTPDALQHGSRFSWSTVATAQTHQAHLVDSPPPSPPPPVPEKYQAPRVESILARHRPVPRAEVIDRADHEPAWAPPPRTSSHPAHRAPPSGTEHPRAVTNPTPSSSALSALRITSNPASTYSTSSLTPTASTSSTAAASNANANSLTSKRLPPPPKPTSPLSHLDALLRAEQDKIHQRTNLERGIARQEKKLVSSPLDVPFSEVREVKRQLKELRDTLDEVRLEEREIGIAISRARRKEGEEEGLWVRRVMS